MKKNYALSHLLLTLSLLCIPILVHAQRDVYLVIGQSNAAGRGAIEAQDMVALSGVDLYNGTTWEAAQNTNAIHPDKETSDGGLNRYSTVRNTNQPQGLNFSYTFGRMLHDVTGNQIGLVVNAIGGSKIQEWEKGAPEGYYEEAISRINAALDLNGSTLKGILWHQGEANRSLSSYLTQLENLIFNLRTDLEMPNLPVIVGQISKQRTDNENFNTNIKKITDYTDAAYIPFTDYVTTDGLQTLDRTHFNSNGQRVLGYRYAAKALKMIYGYTYIENQVIYVKEDSFVRGGSHADKAQEVEDTNLTVRVKNYTTDQIRKGLLKFDIKDLTETSERLIVDATLMVNGNAPHKNTIDINFYDIDTTWSESTVTENNLVDGFTNLISYSTTTFDEDEDDDDNDGDVNELVHGGADLTEYIKDKYYLGTSIIALGLDAPINANYSFTISTKDDTANFELRPHIIISYIDTSIPPVLSNNTLVESEVFNSIKITNPVDDKLIISNNGIIGNVSIFSITGQQLKSKKINSSSGTLNVSNLPSGTYIVVIEHNNKKISRLILKN
ncbi:hypothetical protein APS56_10305 [Pseudalgibacter alginicilyticus]|uniref:Sialate O-acetylesterase domain-containing protein n=1 Tax=Pseudalgibacter alginicilyticus TaxID=1736674 RepID=A0A0P0CM01_9FLAO|nr:sialate O-acetylesterase [Pseudalgibacter alginicilyticus]ALJ05485.1 hypothetical protein APS56_10305 [Pseudalgibacter alginicilyticus]